MNASPDTIELIVREVLKRLAPAPCAQGAGASSAPVSEKPACTVGTVELADSLVTLRSLDGKFTGLKRVVVRPKAVVTPSVRDELKKRGIALERAHTPATASTIAGKRFAIAGDEAAAFTKELIRLGLNAELLPGVAADGLAAVCGAAQSAGMCVFVTRNSAAALQDIHHTHGAKAVLALNERYVRDALKSTAARVLVVDLTLTTLPQAARIVATL